MIKSYEQAAEIIIVPFRQQFYTYVMEESPHGKRDYGFNINGV